MITFTLVILWRNGNSSMEEGLSWQDLIDWMASIDQTASKDLIRDVLIHPDNEQMITVGPIHRTKRSLVEQIRDH